MIVLNIYPLFGNLLRHHHTIGYVYVFIPYITNNLKHDDLSDVDFLVGKKKPDDEDAACLF